MNQLLSHISVQETNTLLRRLLDTTFGQETNVLLRRLLNAAYVVALLLVGIFGELAWILVKR